MLIAEDVEGVKCLNIQENNLRRNNVINFVIIVTVNKSSILKQILVRKVSLYWRNQEFRRFF